MQSIPETVLRPSPSVLFQPLEEGGVLFCARSEVYFSVNHVGVDIWKLLQDSDGDLEGLVRRLAVEYPSVPEEVLREDVGDFLAEALSAGLLEA